MAIVISFLLFVLLIPSFLMSSFYNKSLLYKNIKVHSTPWKVNDFKIHSLKHLKLDKWKKQIYLENVFSKNVNET